MRRSIFALGLCVGLTTIGIIPVVTANETNQAANGKIAFESERDGNFEIYTMNPDGSSQTNVSNNSADEYNPVWSPDGARIAFMTERHGEIEIYTMNADGSGQTRLTNNTAGDYDPIWSPDGTKILFESERDDPTPDPDGASFEIYVMNADGSAQTRLTNNTAGDFDPVWSPNGAKIAFQSERDGQDEIYTMNQDGSAQTRLTNGAEGSWDPEWSPDGTRIAFESERDGGEEDEIYVMNADGSAQTRLTNNTADDYFADEYFQRESWSPDSSKLVFLSNRDGNFEIYVMNADGTGQTRLTNNPAEDGDPSWSPDGTKIVFESERDGNDELYVMNADGTGQTRLTNNTAGDYEPEWQVLPGGGAPPETTILKGPKKKTTDRTPKFTFESSVAGSTFECKLDSKPFSACTSPKSYKKQGFGRHTFQVRATAGGVTDPTPATRKWRVVQE